MNNLTTIAALPQGGGCMSALPAEKNEAKKIEAPTEWTIPAEMLAWPPIDLGPIGGDGPKEWPALEGGYGC